MTRVASHCGCPAPTRWQSVMSQCASTVLLPGLLNSRSLRLTAVTQIFICILRVSFMFTSLFTTFQILPQLLNELKVDSTGDSIDWGTLAVYTCSKNCDEGPTYKAEFLWKQDFSDSNIAAAQ